jgi:hypothetical protein
MFFDTTCSIKRLITVLVHVNKLRTRALSVSLSVIHGAKEASQAN